MNAQSIITRAAEILNQDSDIKMELDLRSQAVIHALCESIQNKQITEEIDDAEKALDEIAHMVNLYHGKRLTWKEALTEIERICLQHFGSGE